MTKKKVVPWFGFTEDKVFGIVMENKDFCKYLLEIIIPDLKIKKIDWINKLRLIIQREKITQKKSDWMCWLPITKVEYLI